MNAWGLHEHVALLLSAVGERYDINLWGCQIFLA